LKRTALPSASILFGVLFPQSLKRAVRPLVRGVGGVAVLLTAAAIGVRLGASDGAAPAAPAPAARPQPISQPIPAPPAGVPPTAGAAEAVASAEGPPRTEADIERWARRPPLRPSTPDADADVQIACIKTVARLRPLGGGTDAENLAAIEGHRNLQRAARMMRGLPPEPPPEPEPKIQCPEGMLFELYERSRNGAD
jgi:hypothetical protein